MKTRSVSRPLQCTTVVDEWKVGLPRLLSAEMAESAVTNRCSVLGARQSNPGETWLVLKFSVGGKCRADD